MSEARGANNDPTMDEILASIRKIISDDEARAQVGRQQAPIPSTPSTAVPALEPRPAVARRDTDNDDVLLLTDLVEEPRSGAAEAKSVPIPPPSVEPPPVEPPRGDALVGSGVVGAASSAFARLNQAVQESVPQPAAHEPGPSIDDNGKTIEDLVREMLRPMLKEWLDRNLPPMVERFVEREIVRLTRR